MVSDSHPGTYSMEDDALFQLELKESMLRKIDEVLTPKLQAFTERVCEKIDRKFDEMIEMIRSFAKSKNDGFSLTQAKEVVSDAVQMEPVFVMKPTSSYLEHRPATEIPKSCENDSIVHEEIVVVNSKKTLDVSNDSDMDGVAHYDVALDITVVEHQSVAKSKSLPWTMSERQDILTQSSSVLSLAVVPAPQYLELCQKVVGGPPHKGSTSRGEMLSETSMISPLIKPPPLPPEHMRSYMISISVLCVGPYGEIGDLKKQCYSLSFYMITKRKKLVCGAGASIKYDTFSGYLVKAESSTSEKKVEVFLLPLGGTKTLNDVQSFLYNLFAGSDFSLALYRLHGLMNHALKVFDKMPTWKDKRIDPENSENRVFVRGGELHIVPRDKLLNPTLIASLSYLLKSEEKCRALGKRNKSAIKNDSKDEVWLFHGLKTKVLKGSTQFIAQDNLV